MAEVAPAPAPAPAASTKTARKRSTVKRQSTGPSVSELILKIVAACQEKNGTSLAAVKKGLAAGGYDVEKNCARIRQAIKNLVTKGVLIQTRGIGASGSFKVAKKTSAESKAPKSPRKANIKGRKPTTKKPAPKKAGVKKAAKKSTAGKPKSPKSVKSRTVTTKKPAAKSPGKAKVKGKPKAKPATKPSAAKSKSSRAKASSGKKGGKK